jgi:hypothetical protein
MEDQAPPEVPTSADPGPYKRARWKVRLALTTFLLALVLVTAEGIARVRARPEPPPLWHDHPLCWRVQTPDRRIEKRDGEGVFNYETDHFGFRGKTVDAPKRPKDSVRIFFLGDEATLAADLPEDATFAGIVQAKLEMRRAPDDYHVEVANAAGPGFFAPVHHATLVHRILPLQPDVVILMSVANEARAALAEGFDERGDGEAPPFAPTPRFMDWLCSVSELASIVRRRSEPPPPEPTPLDRLGTLADRDPPPWSVPAFKRWIRLIAAACKDARADLVLCTQPTLYRDESPTPEEEAKLPPGPRDRLRKTIALYNEEVRSAAPREGARLVDLAARVGCDLVNLKDEVRLTRKGHGTVAEILVQEIWQDKAATRRP